MTVAKKFTTTGLPLVVVFLLSLFCRCVVAGTTFHLGIAPAVINTQSVPDTPVDVATNAVGEVFVVTSADEIHSLSGIGAVLDSQALSGAGAPVAVVATDTGDVYVAKSSGVILRLNSGGLGELASATLPGTPVDITVDSAGIVYVATTDGTIHKRAAALGAINTGSVTGTPTAIHANTTGDIFVTTTGDIHRLNAALTVLSSGSVAGTPIDITADTAGNTIVAASGGRLHRITDTISTLSSTTLAGNLVGVSMDFAGHVVTANQAGTVFVLNTGLGASSSTDVGVTLETVAINLVGDIYALSGVDVASPPAISLSLAAITFPATVVGAGASGPTDSFDVMHVGGGALDITATSSDPVVFEIIGGAAFTLSSGSQPVTIRFRCPAAGTQSGSIMVSATDGSSTVTETVSVSGECYVPTPEACYTPGSTLAFGQVNIGTTDTETFVVENCGNAPLVISDVTFSTTDTVWTGPTPVPPEAFPITLPNNRDTKSFDLRIDVPPTLPADTPYSGLITITTNDGVNPPVKTLDATATGHVPVARVDIPPAYWEIDFRDVEQGFRFSRPLIIRNTGDLALTFDVVRQDYPDDGDHGSFDLETGEDSATFTIGPYDERIFRQTFAPDSLGMKDIVIRVENTNDATFTFQDIMLHGNGTPPIPIDSVLLLDRSGSMADPAGEGGSKIQRLRDAAGIYVELLRDGVDHLGFTRYNDANDNLLPLGEISAVRSTALSTLADIGSGGTLEPDGRTGIGGAMRTASTQYALSPTVTPPDPEHKKVMVVLTDGNENEEPYIMQVLNGSDGQPPLFGQHPDLLTYSVGLGLPGNLNEDRLQEITNRGAGGFYQVTGSLTGLNVYALENFYFKIFADAIGHMMVVDPTYEIGLNETLEVPVGIITEDREALFFFIGELPESAYVFELVDPLGHVITSSSTIGGMSVQIKEKANWTFFKVNFPAPDINHDYVGIWKFRVRIEDPERWIQEPVRLSHTQIGRSGFGADGRHRMSFQASVGSNYRLAASTGPSVVQVGETIILRAALTDGGWPSPDANVRVTVNRPDGATGSVDLYDDGLHGDSDPGDGIFGADYTNTVPGGVYRFDFQSDGVTERGENVTRMATRSQFVGTPHDDPEPDECIPCLLLKWLFVLLIVLLLMILVLQLRRRG